MSAAYKISSLAVGEPEVRPTSDTYPVDLFLQQSDRVSEDLPFGSRGGIAVRHHFPVDGEYTIKVVLQRNSRGYARGLFESHQVDFRLDGARVNFVTIGGGKDMAIPGPAFAQAGTLGNETAELYMLTDVDAHLEARFFAKAGSRVVGVTFVKQDLIPEGPARPPMTEVDKVQFKGGEPYIDHIEVSGPFNVKGVPDTASHAKILTCRPEKPSHATPRARKILSTLARRVSRRPATDQDIQAARPRLQDGGQGMRHGVHDAGGGALGH